MAFPAAAAVLPDPHHLYLAVRVCVRVHLHLHGHTDSFIAADATPLSPLGLGFAVGAAKRLATGRRCGWPVAGPDERRRRRRTTGRWPSCNPRAASQVVLPAVLTQTYCTDYRLPPMLLPRLPDTAITLVEPARKDNYQVRRHERRRSLLHRRPSLAFLSLISGVVAGISGFAGLMCFVIYFVMMVASIGLLPKSKFSFHI